MTAADVFSKLLAVAIDSGVGDVVGHVIDVAKAKHPELRDAPLEAVDVRIDRELAAKLNARK